MVVLTNKVNAQSNINETKERINEISIIEDINIDKLIRNSNKENIVEKYSRTNKTTSRTGTDRTQQNTEEVVVPTYKSISEISISKGMDLTVRTGISKEDFKLIMQNLKQDTSKFFYDNSDLIYDLCEKYEINEIFFCGLISAESGWNIAQNHRNTHNYISLMLGGKLIHYSTVEEGLEVAAQKLHNNYLTPGGKFYGGKTLEGVHKKFCPSSTWVDLVYGRMQQVMTAVNKCK